MARLAFQDPSNHPPNHLDLVPNRTLDTLLWTFQPSLATLIHLLPTPKRTRRD